VGGVLLLQKWSRVLGDCWLQGGRGLLVVVTTQEEASIVTSLPFMVFKSLIPFFSLPVYDDDGFVSFFRWVCFPPSPLSPSLPPPPSSSLYSKDGVVLVVKS